MKKIEAVIKPFELDVVKASLGSIEAAGLTVVEVLRCGLHDGPHDRYRSGRGDGDSSPKVKLEIITDDDQAPRVASTIARAAGDGRGGEASITILHVDDAVRIRTGERGGAAI
jgi:nitrogen regulatory protein P-II 1